MAFQSTLSFGISAFGSTFVELSHSTVQPGLRGQTSISEMTDGLPVRFTGSRLPGFLPPPPPFVGTPPRSMASSSSSRRLYVRSDANRPFSAVEWTLSMRRLVSETPSASPSTRSRVRIIFSSRFCVANRSRARKTAKNVMTRIFSTARTTFCCMAINDRHTCRRRQRISKSAPWASATSATSAATVAVSCVQKERRASPMNSPCGAVRWLQTVSGAPAPPKSSSRQRH